MTLSAQERQRFAEYLEETTRDNQALAKQAEQFNPPLAKKLAAEALACRVVAQLLRATEDG